MLRRVAGPAAGLAVLTAPALFPASAGQYAGSTSDEGNAVTAAEVAPPTDLVAAQTCSPGPGIAYRGHTAASSSTSTVVLTAPSATQVGDVLVAQVTNRYDASNAITAPVGQTVALRPASGPPSASLTWTTCSSASSRGTVEATATVAPISATSTTDGPLGNGTRTPTASARATGRGRRPMRPPR